MLVNADEALTRLCCEECGQELGESEGTLYDSALLCEKHYEEAIRGAAVSLIAAQMRFERVRPRSAFMVMYD